MSIPEVFFRETIDLNRYSNALATKYVQNYAVIILTATDKLKKIDLRQQRAGEGVVIAPQTRKRLRAIIAQQMQDLIDNCLKFHSEYLNEPNAGSSFVNRDFVSARLEPQEITSLLTLFTAGTITQETLLNQLSAGEVLGDDFDVEEEIEGTQQGGLTEVEPPEEPDEEPEEEEEEGEE